MAWHLTVTQKWIFGKYINIMNSWRMEGKIFLDQGTVQSFYVGKPWGKNRWRGCKCLVIHLKLVFAKWCFCFVFFCFYSAYVCLGWPWKFLGVKSTQTPFGCVITQADALAQDSEGWKPVWGVGGDTDLSAPAYWALAARAWQEDELQRLRAVP